MIQEIVQDIFTSKSDIILNGINCFCTQKSGFAAAIKKYFPNVAEDDIKYGRKGDISKLGHILISEVNYPNIKIKQVISIFQQYSYGTDSRKLNYEAFYTGLEKIRDNLKDKKYTLGIPNSIGCGLAGGSWKVVRAMIYDIFDNQPYHTLICKKPESN
jgi:O-acetyl-ADP-ribose deacetylase (regulator of RNase III)